MKFVITAANGDYLRDPGDSLSSHYDDEGYSTNSLDIAVLFSGYQSAVLSLHESGKFSKAAGAFIRAVVMEPRECTPVEVVCPACQGEGRQWTGYGEDRCYTCGGGKYTTEVCLVVHNAELEAIVLNCLDNPDDEARRFVLSDWFEDRGRMTEALALRETGMFEVNLDGQVIWHTAGEVVGLYICQNPGLTCSECPAKDDLVHTPDPWKQDRHNNSTPEWLCGKCYKKAWDERSGRSGGGLVG